MHNSFVINSIVQYNGRLIAINNLEASKTRAYQLMRFLSYSTAIKLMVGSQLPVYKEGGPDRTVLFAGSVPPNENGIYVDKSMFPKGICFPHFRTKRRNMTENFLKMMWYFYFYFTKAYYKMP